MLVTYNPENDAHEYLMGIYKKNYDLIKMMYENKSHFIYYPSEGIYQIYCPACNKEMTVDADDVNTESSAWQITCPICGQKIAQNYYLRNGKINTYFEGWIKCNTLYYIKIEKTAFQPEQISFGEISFPVKEKALLEELEVPVDYYYRNSTKPAKEKFLFTGKKLANEVAAYNSWTLDFAIKLQEKDDLPIGFLSLLIPYHPVLGSLITENFAIVKTLCNEPTKNLLSDLRALDKIAQKDCKYDTPIKEALTVDPEPLRGASEIKRWKEAKALGVDELLPIKEYSLIHKLKPTHSGHLRSILKAKDAEGNPYYTAESLVSLLYLAESEGIFVIDFIIRLKDFFKMVKDNDLSPTDVSNPWLLEKDIAVLRNSLHYKTTAVVPGYSIKEYLTKEKALEDNSYPYAMQLLQINNYWDAAWELKKCFHTLLRSDDVVVLLIYHEGEVQNYLIVENTDRVAFYTPKDDDEQSYIDSWKENKNLK